MRDQYNNSNIEHLYLHIPFCKHLCNYCDFYKHVVSDDQISQFENYLTNTIPIHNELLNKYGQTISDLKTFYLGGGTPSLWDGADFLKDLFKANEIKLNDGCEFTLEVDPGSWTEKTLNRWLEFGVNRISIGTQSMDQRFIEVMDRSHNITETHRTLKTVKSKTQNFSVDFMLGLPHSIELKRDIISELKTLLEYEPTHVSLYILKARKNYLHLKNLPDDDYVEDEYLKVCDYLDSVGLKQYEVSNFSKTGYQSTHNKAYWKYSSVAALGPSATGLINVDDKAIRYKWKPLSFGYSEEKLDKNDILLEKIFLNSRCIEGLDSTLFADQSAKALNLFKNWESRSLGEIRINTFYLNSRGYIVQDSLMDEIFQKIEF